MFALNLKRTARRVIVLGVLTVVALGALLGLRPGTAKGFPIPPITYSIIAVSGSHTASLLNLPVGQIGTYEAPIPVDVDGDLLPDVLVSVNLVNVNGVFNNPPQIGSIIAPNIQIDRIPTAPLLGQNSPPLKIEVQLSIADSSGGPPTTLAFGYNTGQGGSIPTYFHAIVGGLQNFFNPLQAIVDTTGTVVGLQPNINVLGLAPVAAPYQGPLHVIGNLSTPSTTANLDFGFRPFPETITLGYGTDSAGQHVSYADPYKGQVDLSGNISLSGGGSTTTIDSRIDRLPNNLAMTFNSADTSTAVAGSVDVTSSQNGRLPDVGLLLSSTSPGARPLNANMSIDALPPVLHGDWSLPQGGPGAAHAEFCAPAAPSSSPCTGPQGAGIGAIQASITNYAPGSSPIVPYVPDQQQYLNFQQGGTNPANPDTLITARVERIRQLVFTQSATGLDATAQLGDGELPLQAHFVIDGRGGTAPGPYTAATATITPLPASAHVNFQIPPPGTSTAPTVLTYDASSPVDIAGNFTSYGAQSGGACGTTNTICATLSAFHIPSHLVTTINDGASSSQINVDSSSPGTGVADEPDFIADATLGQTDSAHPIVAHAQLLGFPKAVTIVTQNGVNDTLDDAEFHTCDWNVNASPPGCAAGQTPGQIGDLSFDVHDWLTRPAGLPTATATTPMYADVEAEGIPQAGNPTVLYDASGDVKDISELDYVNDNGIQGVRLHVGNGGAFSAHLNAQNIQVDPTQDRISALADVDIPALPSQIDVCVRQPNRTLGSTGNALTLPCEDANPFNDKNPLSTTPLTFSFRSNANPGFNVITSGKVVDEGPDSITNGSDTSVNDDRTYKAGLIVTNLPANLTTNFVMPPSGQKGAIRALYCSGSILPSSGSCPTAAPTDPQVSVQFTASVTDGALACEDPRTPGANQIALCAQGTLANLPSSALVNYDPTKPSNNFSVTTSGDKQMSLVGDAPCPWGSTTPTGTTIPAGSPQCFEFSSLSLNTTNNTPQYLIADGNIANIPQAVTGTLYFPQGGSPDVALTATPALGHVDAVVRNFLAPNPILQSVPARSTGFGDPTQEVSFFQRGAAFEAEAHIGNVSGFSYTTETDAQDTPLDTQQIGAQFGGNQVIRAYADIEPTDADRTLADVTLNNVPAGINICVRGKDTHTSPTVVNGWILQNGVYVDPPGPGQSSFCDNGDSNIGVTPDDGSFQFAGSPAAGASAGLGIDAFIRQSTGGNSSILSGHIHIDGIPDVVEGSIPTGSTTGDLDVGGFDPCGMSGTPACGSGQRPGTMVPAGIQQISADIASFDIDPSDAGWTGTIPYAPIQNHNAPFPVTVPSDGNQYVEAALHDSAFQVRADIGPDSQLQRVQMLQSSCAAPSNNPPDYPAFPDSVNGTTVQYKCISGNFVQTTSTAPLDLGFIDQTSNGNQLSFNGGLTDLPNHIQMTLSDVGTQTDSSLSACGPANSATANCVPPLVRFDQPANSTLFGTLQYGTAKDLTKLAGVQPVETFANMSEAPNPDAASNPWTDWANSSDPDGSGVRAKVGIDNGNLSAIANIQLHVPQSLTIDQPLGWSDSESSDQQDYWQASDTKIHFIVRDANGTPVGSLGQGAIMLSDFDDGYQILAGQPCLSTPLALRGSNPGSCSDFAHGFTLPGEVGIDMYRRDNSGQGKDYMQIDGRVSRGSSPLDIGVRLLALGEQAAIGRLEGQILNVPTTADVSNLGPNDPTFRLQEEMIGNGTSPPTGGQNPTPSGEQTQSACSSAFFCSQVDVKIQSVFASFDFDPSGNNPARLVQAVIDQVGSTKQGMEIAGFSGLTDSTNPAPVSATGFVDINPLNIYIDAGIPLLAGADLALQSEIQANFSVNDSTDFYVRENLLHIETGSNDVGSQPSQVGPLNVFIYFLHAEADLLFAPLLTLDFDPTSVGPADSIPGPPFGPAQLGEVDCSNFGTALVTGLVEPNIPDNTITAGSLGSPNNLLIWPLGSGEPRFVVGGLLGGLFDVVQHFAAPFFCLMGAGASDIPLRETDNYPSDPVGGLSTNPPATTPLVNDSHTIPGATLDPSITPATPPPATPPVQTAQDAPAVTISSPVALCGEHDFGDLTINAPITVATSVPSPDDNYQGSGLQCPAGSEGTLEINAVGHKITIGPSGSINGSHVINSANPINLPNNDAGPSSIASGNAGGGHGGSGGQGASGSGGSTYGDTSSDSTTEGGVAGSPGNGGNGGGAIVVDADTVQIDGGGSITADGGDGGSGSANCAGHDTAGGGGGSGGGVSITAVELDNSGTISANGGNGGNSGIAPGGGGGAGIVKITAPIETGGAAGASGGNPGGIPNAGTGTCPTGSSAAGGNSFTISPNNAQSSDAKEVLKSDGTPKFWNVQDTNAATASQPALPMSTTVPYQAAASNGASNTLQTFLCADYLSTSAYQAAVQASPNDTLNQLFTMPNAGPGVYSTIIGNEDLPCGGTNEGFFVNPGLVLGEADAQANRVDNGSITIGNYAHGSSGIFDPYTGPELPDGYYGLYTVTAVPQTANQDCEDGDNTCTWQVEPSAVEQVIGIDNTPPALAFSADGSNTFFETNSVDSTLNITASGNLQESGLAQILCSNDGTNFTDCSNGTYDWKLASGDGSKTVYVEAVNGAGMVTEQQVPGLLDTTPPTATASVTGGTLVNGWYKSPPSITLSASDNGTGLSPTEAFAYRFDDGTEHPSGSDASCPGPNPNPIPATLPNLPTPDLTPATCTIPQSIINSLSDGTHTLYYTGIDAVGNRLGPDNDAGQAEAGDQPMESLVIQIDRTPPQSTLLSVPAAPDGANGWYATQPWIIFSGVDQVGGSGLTAFLGDDPVPGISYYLDGVLHAAPPSPNPPTAPFQLQDGQHTVCWFAQDLAGNFDVNGSGGNPPTTGQLAAAKHCETFNVDSQAPTTTITTAPASPQGQNGWYTTTVPVTVTGTDPSPSSGISLVDPNQLCQPVTSPPSGASGTCVSIDHAPYVPYMGTFTIPAGTHDVRAYTVDAAGNVSPTVDLPVNVDLTPPVASLITVPGASAQNGWWRSAPYPGDQADSPPQVVLRAVDGAQSSGVSKIQYQINPTASSPWLTYTGPFNVPEGVNTVTYRAIDNAGLIQPTQTLGVPVDVTPPVVAATSPHPSIWLQVLDLLGNILGLSPANAQLGWTVSDNLSSHVHITVLVFNALGAVVRQLDGGTYAVTPGTTLTGSTAWDGRDYTITGLVPIGVYYYRVVATDDAGNVAQSGESKPIQIKI